MGRPRLAEDRDLNGKHAIEFKRFAYKEHYSGQTLIGTIQRARMDDPDQTQMLVNADYGQGDLVKWLDVEWRRMRV